MRFFKDSGTLNYKIWIQDLKAENWNAWLFFDKCLKWKGESSNRLKIFWLFCDRKNSKVSKCIKLKPGLIT